MGHSAAGADETWRAYEARARSTTHLFNAMTGVDHRPRRRGRGAARRRSHVELIADGIHVHPAIWPLITRLKRADRLLLVVPLAIAGTTESRAWDRVTGVRRRRWASDPRRHGPRRFVIALDSAVRNVAGAGMLDAVAAATRNPLELRHRGSRTSGRRPARRYRRARRGPDGAPRDARRHRVVGD